MAVCAALFLIETSVAATALAPAAKPRTSDAVRREQRSNSREISRLRSDIAKNDEATRNTLNELNSINGEMEQVTTNIETLQGSLDSTRVQARVVSDSIAAMDDEMKRLRADCAASMVENRRRRRSLSTLHLLVSSESFYQAMKRAGYVRQLERSRARHIEQLNGSLARLQRYQAQLDGLRRKNESTLAELASANTMLHRKQTEAQTLADRLRADGRNLQNVLAQRQRVASDLDRELTRAIESETAARRAKAEPKPAAPAKAATPAKTAPAKPVTPAKPTAPAKTAPAKPVTPAKATASTSTRPVSAPRNEDPDPASAHPRGMNNTAPAPSPTGFAANKGRLLFPVSGHCNIVGFFGKQRHPSLAHVMIDNSGIDIEATGGAKARAVYDGEVSSIFYMDGLNNVVMVRHGEYLTVYANIDQLAVKKGDVVKTGQAIGRIYSDKTDGNRTVLHFEVRRETQKLNPLEWVKR